MGETMFLRNGLLFDINAAHEIDGVQFPRGFFGDAQARDAYEITEAPDPVYPDGRFYTALQNPDGSLTVTPRDVDEVKTFLKSAVAEKRLDVETAGVAIADGIRIGTDKTDQASVTGAMMTLQLGFVTVIDWKGANGWVSVTLEQLTPIAQAVASHVQACFTAEKAKCDEIDAATTIAELEQIDLDAGWPTSSEGATP